MASFLFSGVFDLPWWGYAVAALMLTHVTIVAVTVFLHRKRSFNRVLAEAE
jgi:stearoyl-CoA desaturase (delta-9 desaturase)